MVELTLIPDLISCLNLSLYKTMDCFYDNVREPSFLMLSTEVDKFVEGCQFFVLPYRALNNFASS